MRLLRVTVFCAVLGFARLASAQTTPPDDSRWSLAPLGLRGSLTPKTFAHFDETPNDHRHFRDEAILQVEWSRRFADELTFQIPERSAHRSGAGEVGDPTAHPMLTREA